MTPEDFFAAHDLPPIEAYEEEGIKAQLAPLSDGRVLYQVETKLEKSRQIGNSTDPIIPNLVFPTSLYGKPIPEQEWIVDGWIPVGDVSLFYGDGGVGKTLLSQQLMVCTALGKPWCTLPVHRCVSLGVFCEDDNDELHRRQDAIQRHLMTNFDDVRLNGMAWWTRKGEDNLLCTFDYEGKIQLTPLYAAILEAAQKIGARLIILDTAADLFGGNENDRSQVRQFIGALSRLAMTVNGAVVLCAHPSRNGMASGTGDGGSTGWSNSARSRLSLERPKADGDGEPDTNERLLTKKKANKSSVGDFIKLRWNDGVIASSRPPGLTSSTVLADALGADRTFLLLLARLGQQGVHVSHSRNAGNFAPKVFSKRPDREGFTLKEFDAAMNRLFAANAIRVGEYKTASRHTRDCLVLAPKDDGDSEKEAAPGPL